MYLLQHLRNKTKHVVFGSAKEPIFGTFSLPPFMAVFSSLAHGNSPGGLTLEP
jgi:hypothetical protein